MVYIKEAHPSDGRSPMRGAPKDPKTIDEREIIANDCIKSMKLTIPFVIDDMKNTANRSYAAWPDRIYIVDTRGKVAYKAGRGPWGFKPADAKKKLAELIKKKKKKWY